MIKWTETWLLFHDFALQFSEMKKQFGQIRNKELASKIISEQSGVLEAHKAHRSSRKPKDCVTFTKTTDPPKASVRETTRLKFLEVSSTCSVLFSTSRNRKRQPSKKNRYLGVEQLVPFWFDEVPHAVGSSRQRRTANQQSYQHHVRKNGREVGHFTRWRYTFHQN